MQARRVVLHATGEVRLDALTLPEPGPGEVRLETRLSALSIASELGVVVGNVPVTYPTPLGYQSLARVAALGSAVTALQIGQRVVDTYGHASHALRPAHRPIPVPDHIPDAVALCAVLGEETWRGIRRLDPAPGSAVLVAGAGLLGLLSVFNLTRRGWPAEVIEPDPARRELALALGARAAWHPDERPGTFAFGLDCSASPVGFSRLLACLGRGGRVGVLSDGNWGALTLPRAFHERELTLIASNGGDDYPAYARWLWDHPAPQLEQLFQDTLRPDQLPEAYRRYAGPSPRPVSALVMWTETEPSAAIPR